MSNPVDTSEDRPGWMGLRASEFRAMLPRATELDDSDLGEYCESAGGVCGWSCNSVIDSDLLEGAARSQRGVFRCVCVCVCVYVNIPPPPAKAPQGDLHCSCKVV